IKAVISNNADAYGLTRAKQAGIPAITVAHRDFEDRLSFDRELANVIQDYQPDLVVLAGFMRILTAEFVAKFKGKLLNIHPSLLPKYPGLNTHRKALENHDKYHGTSVHFVTEELDGGPLIGQSKTEILAGDDEQSLIKRVQDLEHKLYPHIANLFLNDSIKLQEDHVYFENNLLESAIVI
ncbi:MAG: phosphoribosylglycinamide formyltransferase, partial [Kangiellaceae bacterium]